MPIFSKIPHICHLLAAPLLLPILCACSLFDYNDCESIGTEMPVPQIATDNQYISLNIVVSSGKENITRATPEGGEDGDGREMGFERENKVSGITFMLYEVIEKATAGEHTGINDITDNDILAFIQYYPVTLVEKEDYDYPTNIEAVYTTGGQPLGGSGLDLAKTYRAIVVANLDMTKDFNVGSKVVDVRQKTVSSIYTGSGIGIEAKDFVMALEDDNTIISFKKPTQTPSADGQMIDKYEIDNIRIERLAARMDFWTKGATYTENDNYSTPGYEYSVYKNDIETTPTSNDKFVLTAIRPFNLYSGTEYLIKRIQRDNGTFYLADETVTQSSNETNYVLDPNTWAKNNATATCPSYMESDKWLANLVNTANGWLQMKLLHDSDAIYDHTDYGVTAPNIIVCYPKENTLLKESPLYCYATGLCIEGDYYPAGRTNPEHLIYYGYLRHQGEGDGSYTIKPADELTTDEISAFAMNYGVVRNNIYRISIDKVTEKRSLELKITVKQWDKFEHDIIYM